MAVDKVTHNGLQAVDTPSQPQELFHAIDDLNERITELGTHHRTLARLTKQSYSHSQQVWHQSNRIEKRLAAVEARQDEILQEVRAVSVMVASMSDVVQGLKPPAIISTESAETPLTTAE